MLAPSRRGEGYILPSGGQKTCLVDAVYNGIQVLAPGVRECTLQRLRKDAMPILGDIDGTSVMAVEKTLIMLNLPYTLVDITDTVQGHTNGPLYTILRLQHKVMVVGLHVTVDGVPMEHCVMVTTLPTDGAPLGKIVDNYPRSVPGYLQANDKRRTHAAKVCLYNVLAQNTALHHHHWTAELSNVFELKKTA